MTTPPPQIAHVTQQHSAPNRVLAIAALAMGLVALLTLVVAALYARPGLIVSAFFGVIAGGIAVAALVMKHRPLGAVITGLTTGVISVILSIVIMVASMVPPLLQAGEPAPYSPIPPSSSSEDPDTPGTPDTPNAPDVATPQHMSSGGVVFGEGMVPLHGPRMDVTVGPTPQESDSGTDAVDIVVYVDYRCPHCLSFEQANGALLQQAVSTNRATVEIRPVTFMDRFSEGSAYSSRAAGFLACTVETQPDEAWLAHSMLLTPNVQPVGEGPGLTNDDLLELAAIAFAVSDELRSCVINDTYVPFAQLMNEWTFTHPVLGATDPNLTITGTPSVVIQGELYGADPTDEAALRAHLTSLGVFAERS